MTLRNEITRVFREGKQRRTRSLVVRLSASPLSHVRVCIIVPKLKQTAVARNRLKRRLREIIRLDLLDVAARMDMIVLATKEAYGRSLEELRAEIKQVRTMVSPNET